MRDLLALLLVIGMLAGCDQTPGSDDEPDPEPNVQPAHIMSFTTSDELVTAGTSVTLTWGVSGDEPLTLTLDPGGTDVSGETSATVPPAETTTYRLTAENEAGTDEAETIVRVLADGEAALDVAITGLPDGAAAHMALTDHDALMHWVRTGEAMVLAPGTYTVAAAGVRVSGTTYLPDESVQTVSVTGGEIAPLQVHYTTAPGDLYATAPDVPACAEGALTTTTKERGRMHLNFIRALVGLPPVGYDSGGDAMVQQASLMFAANGAIDHDPPTTWHCYTEDGADGAARSNIGITARNSAIGAVPEDFIALWADDVDVPSLGHRRWLVDPFLADVAVGLVEGTPQAGAYSHAAGAALRIVGDADADIAGLPLPFVAYPRGDFPTRLFTNDWFFSFSVLADPSARFNNHTQIDYGGVSIRVEDETGSMLGVTDIAFDHTASGLPNQLKWKVTGLEDDRRYTVIIEGVMVNGEPRTFTYPVRLR